MPGVFARTTKHGLATSWGITSIVAWEPHTTASHVGLKKARESAYGLSAPGARGTMTPGSRHAIAPEPRQ
jgi:hypothetical protein